MELVLTYIDPLDLHKVWDKVRAGLLKVEKYGNHWIPEDVYKELKDTSAHLHIGTMNDEYVGFIVTQQQQSYDGMVIHIWAAYSNKPKSEMVFEKAITQVEQWAQAINAKRIRFTSPRKGWEKNGMGYRPTLTIYEKSL